MTVVFEILSPSNTAEEMRSKQEFYEEYGVEEYFIYDPLANKATVYLRHGSVLRRHRPVQGFVSPRLGIRFDLTDTDMLVYYPDGRLFLSPEQLDQARCEAEIRATTAETQLTRVLHLSRKVRQGQASAEEIAELDRLEGE